MNFSIWEPNKPQIMPWQNDFIFKRFDDDLALACTAISAGKTAALSIWIVLQCIKKPGIRGIIIAQTYRALHKVLIASIEGFCRWAGIDYSFNKGSMEIKFPNGSILYAYSAENPNAVLGLSEISLLAIDEAAYCNEEIYNNARDRMRGGCYAPMVRLISSPSIVGRVQNWFTKLVKKYPNKVVKATYLDNIFTSDEFKKELEERYVIGSNLFRQQCLGEIFDTDVASQIIFRNQFNAEKSRNGSTYWFGADMSGLGADSDMYVVIDQFGIVEYKEAKEADTFQKTNIVNTLYNTYKVKNGYMDATGGYAQGTLDLVGRDNLNGVNFAQKAFNIELYPNARTEMYMELAAAVKNGFWVNDIVREEMLAQSIFINNKGQTQLVPKDEVKKLLGHSPDLCDATALAVYAMNHSLELTNAHQAEHAAAVAERYMNMFNAFN